MVRANTAVCKHDVTLMESLLFLTGFSSAGCVCVCALAVLVSPSRCFSLWKSGWLWSLKVSREAKHLRFINNNNPSSCIKAFYLLAAFNWPTFLLRPQAIVADHTSCCMYTRGISLIIGLSTAIGSSCPCPSEPVIRTPDH